MPAPLQAATYLAPGNRGLNTEDAAFVEDPSWSLRLDNGVIDSAGRVAARKGWVGEKTGGASITGDVVAVHEYIDTDTSAIAITNREIYAADDKFFESFDTPAAVTGGTMGTSQNDWQFLNFNGKCVALQQGLILKQKTGANSFADVVAGSGTLPAGNAGAAAFGRLWITDEQNTVVQFSGLLDETDWGGAGAGSIDTLELWPDGIDSVTAVAELQNQLVIFGNRSILIFTGLDDPAGNVFGLVDIIQGHGCIARDSVQRIGNDLLYLADDGVRSLRRGIQFSNLPLTSMSDAVRGDLVEAIASLGSGTVKSFYSEIEGLYGLKIGASYFAFSTKQLDNGDLRASKWFGNNWTSATTTSDGSLYFGQTGEVGLYSGYTDDGSAYTFRWRSVWLAPSSTRLFFGKRAKLTLATQADYNVSLLWATDYIEDFTAEQRALPITSVSEWVPADVATVAANEWTTAATDGEGEWSGGSTYVKTLLFDLSNEGERWALEVSVPINGTSFAVQKIDLFGKVGRIAA